MQTYGILGNNISYTLSPFMQNAAFESLGIDAQYRIFDMEEKEVDSFMNSLIRSDITGINVTVPYKEKAYAFIKKYGYLDKYAENVGAVNTILVKDGSIYGYNTDGLGFERSLKEDLGVFDRMKMITIIGAGGAAKACAGILAQNTDVLCIIEKVQKKAEELKQQMTDLFLKADDIIICQNDSQIKYALSKSDLLVNATPCGTKEGDIPVKKEYLHSTLKVYDLIYLPSETELLKSAKEIGCDVANGLGMLLYQGTEAFTIWTGKEAPVSQMKEALINALKKREQ